MRSDRLIEKQVASGKWQVSESRAANNTLPASRPPLPALRATLFIFLVFLLLPPSTAAAQTQPPNYWQYRAADRLQHAVAADLDGDSIDDFIVIDESGKVDLLDASGNLQNSYTAPGPVLAIHTSRVDNSLQSEREIILGLRNRLILLSASGAEIWQVPLTPVTTPTDLLTSGGQDAAAEWLAQYEAIPVSLDTLDWDEDGRNEIVVLLNSGQIQLFSASGDLIWRYARNSSPNWETQPHMTVADLDQDGQAEIALGLFNPHLRFSQLALIGANGRLRWEQEQPISGRITALDIITRADGQPAIAVGTNLGHIALYDADRQRLWLRTINKPITSLTPIPFTNTAGLAVGTEAGSVIAYDEQGRRQWTRHLAPNADRSIMALSAASFMPPDNQPALAAVLGAPPENAGEPADVVLLAGNGRTLDTLADVEALGPTRLLDMNGDGANELLLTRFAQIELLGLGIGASEFASDWDYDLLGLPDSLLVIDFEQDGEDELLVGTENGRIHRLNNDGSFSWVVNPGVAITHLAALPNPVTNTPDFVVARNHAITQPDASVIYESGVALRQANGEQIWAQSLSTQITSLQVAELNGRGRPEIIVGAGNGDIIVYSSAGNELWRASLPERVEQLLTVRIDPAQDPLLIAVTTHRLYLVNPRFVPWIMASYTEPIQAVYPFKQPNNEAPGLIIFVSDNQTYGITLQGRHLPPWPLIIDGPPTHSLFAQELPLDDLLPQNTRAQAIVSSFLYTTDAGHLRYLVIEEGFPRLSWLLTGLGNITSLYWGDLDSDGVPNMAVGDENGRVDLYTIASNTRHPELIDRLNLGSHVFALTVLQRENSQKSDLLSITQNGVVQLFRVQENRPPLLTNPEVEAAQGRYNLVVSVNDAERDDVAVRLDVFDPAVQQWIAQEEKQLSGGGGKLFWLLDNPPTDENGVRYRFHYNDGFHQGDVTPPPAPPPVLPPRLNNRPLLGVLALGISGLVFTLVYLRQSQLPTSQARRFYRDLAQEPASTLIRIEKKYQHSRGAPDFLLSLANQARQRQDLHIAGLSDGLFLLENQPRAGLPIIIKALKGVRQYAHPPWEGLERWQYLFSLGRALLEAPSITELSLLRPQLEQLLSLLEDKNHWSPALDALLLILSNLRDSKRVDLAADSLVYLNEADVLLNEFWDGLSDQPGVERPLIAAIVSRWTGLVSAAIEDLRGRANLVVTLKTKRLVPTDQTEVALEIRNNGRAAAENIIVALEENPAYARNGRPQIIPLLPPGRVQQVSFSIEPQVKDHFRLVLNLTYDDRNQRDKAIAFGDMVHLLPPTRDFRPIANPYLPGTPLRRSSAIFFGRQDLFDFIADNAGRQPHRNVLILVGQRRTGKTSILLRLAEHLPANQLPVYIDCQSLGVMPGMPALLYDLAWTIADALAARGIDLDVPEPALWQDEPTRFFQRQFLPLVHALLPEDTTLLLVFDEFEAFQNLVQDGILPPTLFPYLRHLMQHSEALSFVFVGSRRLEEMSADYWSVLFNIALYQKIGYLAEEVAKRLIQEPVAPNLVYDDLAIDKILRVTAGHPYFLQLVCYTLVKQANSKRRSYVTISNVNAALDEMLSLGEMHFAYLWQRSTYAEKALLTAVSHMMDQDISCHPADMVQYLEPYGIHLTPAEVTAALKRLVERDILQEVTEGTVALYELKIGLVGLWAAKHKSLTHLYK